MKENTYGYNMMMTLENHFENLAEIYPAVRELHSLWVLLKKRMEDELLQSRSVFVHYSLHDGSHSRSILQAIERFLGEDRILRLSATDTFMILASTYAHDYGMAQSFNKIYDILGSDKFKKFLERMWEKPGKLEEDEKWAVNNLLTYMNEGKPTAPLNDIYFSISMVIQLYLRPKHWKGAAELRKNFEGLFLGQMKNRFISGYEGIVEICMCHGKSMEDVMKLSMRADGMAGDDYHPRFVAAMLRLGDLLDMDNGRFPTWFVSQIAQNKNVIPRLSVLHFKKHEAISHLLITPERMEVMAHCYSRPVEEMEGESKQKREAEKEKALKECYEVAALISEWTAWLTRECQQLVLHWNEIAQPHFGGPPAKIKVSIFVDGREYMAENKALQMKMSQERVMNLLEGTNIYRDKYVGIREMLQNAIDASLLQLWSDLLQNRYKSYGLSRAEILKDSDLLMFMKEENKASVFGNYDITVEVIKDKLWGKVFLVVKDRGIGITKEEVKYIADMGSSKEENQRIRSLIETMPAWMKPSGVFGIGLQSVFQITDCLEFYTRQHNEPEYMISLYSYGKNMGKIEAYEMPENKYGLYNDNAIPGTNVKITIEPKKLLGSGENRKSKFKYYDPEFDTEDEMDMIYSEICRACEEIIGDIPFDYFNVFYEPKVIDENGEEENDAEGEQQENGQGKTVKHRECLRKSSLFPYDEKKKTEENHYVPNDEEKYEWKAFQYFKNVSDDGYSFTDNKAFFWDKKASRCYILSIRPCKIYKNKEKTVLSLPEKVPNLYKISYKFNSISDAGTIYGRDSSPDRLRAGLLNLEVLILDDQPTHYMNIDRDRLREGAISEEELLEVRTEMLARWCKYFCDAEEKGTENKSGGKLEGKDGILFSLILLFYQNVPDSDFKKFMSLYMGNQKFSDYYLEKDEILVKELWNPEKKFHVVLPPSENGEKETPKDPDEIRLQNIYPLPHRLVHIEEIQKVGDKLRYVLRLIKPEKQDIAIKMDEEACLYDYMNVFDKDSQSNCDVCFESAAKRVFKPDEEFKKILVPCFPQTFSKGRNWEGNLDYCINGYILSPFEQETLIELENFMKSKRNNKGKIVNGDVESEYKENFVNAVMKSRQLKNCVSYVKRKREEEGRQQVIEEEYRDFIDKFYRLLSENVDRFLDQFKKI